MKNASLIIAGIIGISALVTIFVINNQPAADTIAAPQAPAESAESITCPAERPVRCPDNTCASSVTECSQGGLTDVAPTEAVPSESSTSTNRAQNHNSSRSNRTTGANFDDLDSDDDGLGDGTEGELEFAPANYNNTRSNRSTIA